jgi:hypothetical protein
VDLLVAGERQADLDTLPEAGIGERHRAHHPPRAPEDSSQRDGGQAPARLGTDD